MDSGSEQIYRFQIAAFKIIRGGHYILGPRSQSVTAGKGMETYHANLTSWRQSDFFLAACSLVNDKMIKLRHNTVKES